MPIPFAQRLPDLQALCWKCDGKGNLPHYNHIAAGICFACQGSGRCSIRQYTDGVRILPDSSLMFMLDGKQGSGLFLLDGTQDPSRAGLMLHSRKDSLELIKGGLDGLKRGYRFGCDYEGNLTTEQIPTCPRDFVNDAVRLACLNDSRACERAILYVAGEAGEKLRLALVGAQAALEACRAHADRMGWDYHRAR